MLCWVTDDGGENWDLLLSYVLFAVCKAPQASTWFIPFELLYGQQPRGLLDIAKEAWEKQPSPFWSFIKYVAEMQ